MGKRDEEVYEVVKILKMRVLKKKREFWVKWKGYTPDNNTWEPEENLAESVYLNNLVR